MAFFAQESAVSGTTYTPQMRPKSPHMVKVCPPWPTTSPTTKGTFGNLALVVDCETVVAEDGVKLTHDVGRTSWGKNREERGKGRKERRKKRKKKNIFPQSRAFAYYSKYAQY